MNVLMLTKAWQKVGKSLDVSPGLSYRFSDVEISLKSNFRAFTPRKEFFHYFHYITLHFFHYFLKLFSANHNS